MSDMSSAALASDARCDGDGARKRPRHLYPKCAKKHGGKCQLLQHRRYINEVLLHGGLELREDVRGRSGGDARLAVARIIDYRFCDPSDEQLQSEPLNLARGLLLEHRCITAVELTWIAMKSCSLLAVLERNDEVKSLTFWLHGDGVVHTSLFMLTNTLSRIDELIFMDCFWYEKIQASISVKSILLEDSVTHLTTLDVAHLAMTGEEAARFILSLVQSQTITNLTIGPDVMCYNDGKNFCKYLTKKRTSLKKLTYVIKTTQVSPVCIRDAIVCHIKTLCTMKTLEELTFDFDDVDAGNSRYCAMYAKLVSRSLRCLRLPRTPYSRWVFSPSSWFSAECMEPWLAALRKNSKLNELRIDLWCFRELECRAFFEAVAGNATLRRVVVRHLPYTARLDVMCRTIRELGLSDRVVVEEQYYRYQSMRSFQECSEIAGVTFCEHCAVHAGQGDCLEDVREVFEALSLIRRRISLRVKCEGFDRTTFDALTALVRRRSAHTAVELDMEHSWRDMEDWQIREVASELLSALASNPKLTRVSIYGLPLPAYDYLHHLAESASKNLNLVHFCLTPVFSRQSSAFSSGYIWLGDVRMKAPPSSENSVLVKIQEASGRNASRVLAAAGFVLRRQDSVYGARYLESIHDHPWLLELVREGAAVSDGEAKALISDALKEVRYCSAEQFLRMAGVVSSKVECIGSGNTGANLANIGEHCWLHIRQYLKLDDVVEAGHT